MKLINSAGALLMSVAFSVSAGPSVSTNSVEALREKLFQRFLAEADSISPTTNRDRDFTNSMRFMFDRFIVDPTFGLGWDEVPAPNFTGPIGMAPVQAFVKTNGWNMATNDIFGDGGSTNRMKPIRGLPGMWFGECFFSFFIKCRLFFSWSFSCSGCRDVFFVEIQQVNPTGPE